MPSLFDTHVRTEFLLRNTADPTGRPIVDAFQTEMDQKRGGELSAVGGTTKICEFRAATDESPELVPYLRCKTNYIDTDVFPLGGVPFGRGFLVVAGMDFGTTAVDNGIRIASAQFEKVCVLLTNLVNRIYNPI